MYKISALIFAIASSTATISYAADIVIEEKSLSTPIQVKALPTAQPLQSQTTGVDTTPSMQWQIYQQVEKGLPPPILSPEKLAMQHRELIDAVEAHDLVRMQRAILQYFQSIRQRLQQGGHDAN